MDRESRSHLASIRRAIGVPDGNGHGTDTKRLIRTAFLSALGGGLFAGGVWTVREAGAAIAEGVVATRVLYGLPPRVTGLEADVQALKTRPPHMPPETVKELAKEIAKELRRGGKQ